MLFLSGYSLAWAKGVPAGDVIESKAQAKFDNGKGAQTVESNTVSILVDEVLDAALSSLNAGPVATGPGSAILAFELTNSGNGPEAFRLTVNPAVVGDDFDPEIGGIAVDTNGNGVYDPGIDQPLASAVTDPLAADSSVKLFVLLTVAANVANGSEGRVELTAEALTGTGTPGTLFDARGVNGGDAIVGLSGAASKASGTVVMGTTSVNLVKSAAIADPFGGITVMPGATITYTIMTQVEGIGSVDNLVVVDGIPAGTTYRPGTLKLGGVPLTDSPGDDAGKASAAGVEVTLGTVAGGNAQSITFQVSIN